MESGDQGDEGAYRWRASVLTVRADYTVGDADLRERVWEAFRHAFTAKPFLDAREIAPMSEGMDDAQAPLPMLSLVFGRAERASIGIVQISGHALRFDLASVRELELSVGVPARGPGGYALDFMVQSPEARAGAGLDSCAVILPFAHAAETTLGLLRATLRIAAVLEVRAAYETWSDV